MEKSVTIGNSGQDAAENKEQRSMEMMNDMLVKETDEDDGIDRMTKLRDLLKLGMKPELLRELSYATDEEMAEAQRQVELL